MLTVNLLRWCNFIGWLSRDIGQHPVIEISNSGCCFHRKMLCVPVVSSLIKLFVYV